MKNLKTALFFVTILISGNALAERAATKWNVDVFAGKQLSDNLRWDTGQYDTDSGLIYGVGLSRNISSRAYLGIEFNRTKNLYSGFENDIRGRSLMFTAKYDFLQKNRFSAYAGLGLGFVKPSYHQIDGKSFSDNVKGGQVVLGARYRIAPRVKYFMEARRMDTFEDFDVAGAGIGPNPPGSTAEYKGDSIVFGVQYSF